MPWIDEVDREIRLRAPDFLVGMARGRPAAPLAQGMGRAQMLRPAQARRRAAGRARKTRLEDYWHPPKTRTQQAEQQLSTVCLAFLLAALMSAVSD